MVLRIKNFNILAVHWKMTFRGGGGEGGGSRKTNIEWGCIKKWAWYPNAHYDSFSLFYCFCCWFLIIGTWYALSRCTTTTAIEPQLLRKIAQAWFCMVKTYLLFLFSSKAKKLEWYSEFLVFNTFCLFY